VEDCLFSLPQLGKGRGRIQLRARRILRDKGFALFELERLFQVQERRVRLARGKIEAAEVVGSRALAVGENGTHLSADQCVLGQQGLNQGAEVQRAFPRFICQLSPSTESDPLRVRRERGAALQHVARAVVAGVCRWRHSVLRQVLGEAQGPCHNEPPDLLTASSVKIDRVGHCELPRGAAPHR